MHEYGGISRFSKVLLSASVKSIALYPIDIIAYNTTLVYSKVLTL